MGLTAPTYYPCPADVARHAQSRFFVRHATLSPDEFRRGLLICRPFRWEDQPIKAGSVVILANRRGVDVEFAGASVAELDRSSYRIVPTAEVPADVRLACFPDDEAEPADPRGGETLLEQESLAALATIARDHPGVWASIGEVACLMPDNRGHLAGVLLPRLARRERPDWLVEVNFRGGEPCYRLMPVRRAVAG